MSKTRLAPVLTPLRHLRLEPSEDASALDPEIERRLMGALERGSGRSLLQLGPVEVSSVLPSAFSDWRELGARYVTAVCTLPDVQELEKLSVPAPPPTRNSSASLRQPRR